MDDPELDAGRANLLGLLRTEESWTDTLRRVAALACATIPGCDAGSVTLWREGHPYTVVSTDDLAQTIDDAQYDVMEGPCLDASRYGEAYVIADMADEPRWPTFAGVAAQRGARSSLSLPLVVANEPIGALNLYATKPRGFEGAEPAGRAFAKQASVAIANARVYQASRQLAESLDAALRSSAESEQAKGRALAERAFRRNAPAEGSEPPTLEG
ncbi:MAG TPA: GAF domain-containing protein [Frankiaceae bacterium]|nr:GAF domain-containing protein [Frankiaceae bacterium]